MKIAIRSNTHTQRFNLRKRRNNIIKGKGSSDKYAKDITALEKFIDSYSKKHYFVNSDVVDYYCGNTTSSIDFHLNFVENGVKSLQVDTTYNMSTFFDSNDYWGNTSENTFAYIYKQVDPYGKSTDLKYNIKIRKPQNNHIFLNNSAIDLYPDNNYGYLAIANSSNLIHTPIFDTKDLSSSTDPEKTYTYFHFFNYKNTYKEDGISGEYISIDSCLTMSKLVYNNKIENAFYWGYNAKNNIGNANTYTIVKKPSKFDYSYHASRDGIIKYFNIKSHIKGNKAKQEIYIDKYIETLVKRGIIDKIATNTVNYSYFDCKAAYRDISKRYIKNSNDGNELTYYIGDFNVNIKDINVASSSYIKNGPAKCDVLALQNKQNIYGTYTLLLAHSKDSDAHPIYSSCIINAHSLNVDLSYKNLYTYTYYLYDEGLQSINVSDNFIYKYKFDNNRYSVANIGTSNNIKVSHKNNAVILPQIKTTYTYNNGIYTSNAFNIRTNITNNTYQTTNTYMFYYNCNFSGDNGYTYAYIVPLQKPTFNAITFTKDENDFVLKMTQCGTVSRYSKNDNNIFTLKSTQKIFYITNGSRFISKKVTPTDAATHKFNLTYSSCKFMYSANSKGTLKNVNLYNNVIVGTQYNKNWYQYPILNQQNNIEPVNCNGLLYAYLFTCDEPQRYVIWEKNNDNKITYITSGSYIYFGKNNTIYDAITGDRTKTIYYINKGNSYINTFNVTYTNAKIRDCRNFIENNNYKLAYEISENNVAGLPIYAYTISNGDKSYKINVDKYVSNTLYNKNGGTDKISKNISVEYYAKERNNVNNFICDVFIDNAKTALFTITYPIIHCFPNNQIELTKKSRYLNSASETVSYYIPTSVVNTDTLQYILASGYYTTKVNITEDQLICHAGNEHIIESNEFINGSNFSYYKYACFTYLLSSDVEPQIITINANTHYAYNTTYNILCDSTSSEIKERCILALKNNGNIKINIDASNYDKYKITDKYFTEEDKNYIFMFDEKISSYNPITPQNILLAYISPSTLGNENSAGLKIRTTLNSNSFMVNDTSIKAITGRTIEEEETYSYLGPMSLTIKSNPYVTYVDAFGFLNS